MSTDRWIQEALARAPPAEQYRPVDLRLDRRTGLHIAWADGTTSDYPLVYLRKHCPCATCRAERDRPPASAGAGGNRHDSARAADSNADPAGTTGHRDRSIPLTILPRGIDRAATFIDAKLMGNYAIQITWGDGHSTGIYDFKYLRVISPPAT